MKAGWDVTNTNRVDIEIPVDNFDPQFLLEAAISIVNSIINNSPDLYFPLNVMLFI